MLLFALVAFTGCKKDDDDNDQNVKMVERLIGKWQMVELVELVTIGGGASQRSVTVPANRASFFTFNTNGSLIVDGWDMESEDPADWTKADVENGKYTMSSNGQSIAITDADGEIQVLAVKELTASRLVLEFQADGGGNVTMTMTITFKKV